MINKTPLQVKSYNFALRIIKLNKYLQSKTKEFIISKQLLRSGTAIGALIREAEFAQSNADYISKFSIALKEANETLYWLSLLKDSNEITNKEFNSIEPEISELIKLLVSSIKTLKSK